MISIELDEKTVFAYNADTLTIHMWDHQDGKWEGPVIGQVGKIKFADEWQVHHFMEMLQFIIDKLKEKRNDSVQTAEKA